MTLFKKKGSLAHLANVLGTKTFLGSMPLGEPTEPRKRAIQRLTALLLRRGSPRFQMMLFLLVTGLAGFLSSALLHAAGLTSMMLRYPLAVAMAYLVFLLLLCLFVTYHRSRHKRGAPGSSEYHGSGPYFFDVGPGRSYPPASTSSSSSSSGQSGGGGSFDLGSGNGEGAVVVVVVVLILIALSSAILASILVLMEAPVLLAEILVDGLLLVGLARRIDSRTSPHWTTGVIRRTVVPLLLVAVCFATVGYALEKHVPGATTMGEVLYMARSR